MSHTDQLNAALAGRYQIERKVGVGGMATVYAARDVKHDRRVALKVLKPELGAVLGPERFLAEIRVTANLQHPNLLPLFDSGEADGLLFYVMPFVDGETLRAWLEREKQLPVDEAVRLAVSVAGALDYAHRQGVIHRDLKPENILLREGQALVADFGIALAVSNAGGNRITQTGLSLGTPQYMSPEQATGDRQIDGRTDVYSLAAVLYEMLSGDPPHLGGTAQAVISRVLTERPRSIRASRPSVPANVDASVLRALEKLPADRFATAHEFADALLGRGFAAPPDVVLPASVENAGPRADRTGLRARKALPWVLAVVFAGTTLASWVRISRQPPPATTRFALNIPARQQFAIVNGIPVVFSPDGRAILYSGLGGPQGRQLYYRRLDELEARPLAGTDNASTLFFSYDGKTIGFSQGPSLRTMSISGGAPITIAGGGFRSPTWVENGDMYLGSPGGLLRIRAGQRTPEPLTHPDSAKGELSHGTPIVAPDGKTLVYWVRSAPPHADHLALFHLDTKQGQDIDGEAQNPIGIIDGYLIFGRQDGTLNAIRYDSRTLRSLVDAVPVLEGVTRRGTGGAAASLSRNGSLVYVHGGLSMQFVVTDESAKVIGTPTEVLDFTDALISPPAFAPDGRRVAVSIFQGGGSDIWIYDLSTSILSRLTSFRGVASNPTWTPDGRRVAFIDRGSGRAVWWIAADGSGSEERLVALTQAVRSVTFSPDGKYAVINSGSSTPESANVADLLLLPLAGDRKPTTFVHTMFSELNPAISFDGKWIAYQSNSTGRYEINVRPFPGLGGAIQLSAGTGGATDPQWLRDGRLVYRTNDTAVVMTLTKGPVPSVAKLQRLFEARAPFAASPDGKRFAMLRSLDNNQEVVVVLNWINELRAKMAAASKK
ncbi:MAG TPA: protein kinase [Gemmatimonadaceae bacterium]|jgi:eukaryotic-like serine/threonine-protein kinase|nr:protein kinase [Gemmatimonadaceae bacterium]